VRRWAWAVGLLLLASACGGGGSDGSDAASGLVVASADGIATLAIEPGSLPEGVTPEDLTVEAAFIESDDPAMPVVVVQLLPDGLVLEQPAALAVALPDVSSGGLVAIHVSGSGLEFLAGEISLSGERLVFTTEVAHFSVLELLDFREAGFDAWMSLRPKQVTQGESQAADAGVTFTPKPVGAWVPFPSDPSGTVRLVRFSEATPSPQSVDGRVQWGELWDPPRHNLDRWDIGFREYLLPEGGVASRCTWPNESLVSLRVSVSVFIEVLSVGEPVATAMLDFAEVLSPESDPLATSEEIGPLLGVAPGNVVEMEVYISVDEPTSCVSEGSESTTSTSSTSPPTDETASSLHLSGSAGDFTCEDPDNKLDPALDITGVDVVQDGDEIEVTLTFEGDAEAYEEATPEKFPFSFQLRLKEDTAGYPEVFFSDKGVLKVSGGLLQVVSYEFSGNKLIIRLTGRTLEDVHAVQASTFTFDGGRCQDLINSPGYND